METEENLQQFELSLIDRFGKLPPPSIELLEVVRLRWVAISLGIERIILKNKKMICYFIADQESPFYQSEVFTRVLSYVQHNPDKCCMKEKQGKLSLSFEKVVRVAKAKAILSEI
jgi:transcription-repair coupling factor (superfamily II helicase)